MFDQLFAKTLECLRAKRKPHVSKFRRGLNGWLDEGPHGPLYFDANGKKVDAGPISLNWVVKANDPSPGIIRISTVASWGEGQSNSQSADLVVYRTASVRGTASTVETVPLSSPTPTPTSTPVPVTYAWVATEWTACDPDYGRSRTVRCQASTGTYASDSMCPAPKPPTEESADSCAKNTGN